MKYITTILTEIPELVIEVSQTLAIGAPNPTPKVRVRRTVPGSRPPMNLDSIDLLRRDPLDGLVISQGAADSHLLDRLGMCVRMVAEERADAGLTSPDEAYGDWSSVVGYLSETADWWTSQPGLGEDIDHEIRQVHRALERAARVPPSPPRFVCTRLGCGATAHLQDGGRWVLCHNGHTLDVEAEKGRHLSMQDWTLTEIHSALRTYLGRDVPIETLRTWAKRGHLQPVREGSRRYNFGAAARLAAARDTKAS